MRQTDTMRMILIIAALVQLVWVTAATQAIPVLSRTPRAPLEQAQTQAVINQKQIDRADEITRRLDRLDARLDALRIGERLVVLEELPKDVRSVQQIQFAIFTALVMNLVATIIQIRTQTRRRDDSTT